MADTSVIVNPGQAPAAPAPAPGVAPAAAPGASVTVNSSPSQHQFTIGGPAPAAPAAPERPQWLPAKFQSPEQMAMAYADLERAYTQSRQAAPQQQTQQAAPNTMTGAPVQQAPSTGAPQGAIDWDLLRADLAQGQQISEGTFRAHEARGVDRTALRAIIDGQKAMAVARAAAVHEAVGGKQTYEQMQAWASANLNADEKIAYSQAVNMSPEMAKIAAQGLLVRFQQAAGQQGQLIQGGAPTGLNDGFRSSAEMTAAIRDPRYKKDSAYRADVERKIAGMR